MRRFPRLGREFKRAAALAVFFCLAAFLHAGEFANGRVKLVLHERTGRFSLYYMTDTANRRYEPLFTDQDPRTSFLTVMVNDRTYKLGESSSFRVSPGSGPNPALVFESAFLTLTEEFIFTRSENSELADGIDIVIRAENKSNRASHIGIRFFLDTNLGEGERAHFEAGSRPVSGETLFTGEPGARWWCSRNGNYGLFGGFPSGGNFADELLVGNWKRLNDAAWKISVNEGRNFNLLPYSVNDSAVAYYFEPVNVDAGASREARLWFSAAGDGGEITAARIPAQILAAQPGVQAEAAQSPAFAESGGDIQADLASVRSLIDRIDSYIASGNISEEELNALELTLRQLRARYGRQ
ncbi:MAG: hypothetical protein LBK40_09635 [Spirochaetaceae bacterium]|jgi:hypothetical protein|nr:hypothetical protein [Spirochaetaceae bacterium]